jgi:hypothetical protein
MKLRRNHFKIFASYIKITIMKNIYKFLILTLVATGTMFYSCETIVLEELTSPNALSPSQADPDLLLNSVQLAYRSSMVTFNNNGADTGRIDMMFGTSYLNRFGGGTMNNPWTQLYSGMIPDIAAIEAQNSPDNDLSFHVGIAKIMQADVMLQLVDWLGDIVFSQANQPIEFPTPEVDDDADVYAAALALLSEANTLLNGASAGTATDLYFGGSADSWMKLGNSIKMRADLNMGNYSSVVNASGVIDSTADDFEFAYGTNQLSPDNRHPDYVADYRSDGANIYNSHWLMDLMLGDFGDLSADTDPRRRYFWYRQIYITPGNYSLTEDTNNIIGNGAGLVYFINDAGNQEVLSCSVESVLPHLEFTPDEVRWCSMHLGYWGRLHGNARGIPPDNFSRTAQGVYPAGGSFDGNTDTWTYQNDNSDPFQIEIAPAWGQQVGFDQGGGGAGIEPMFLASWTDFMKAEANLQLGNTGAAATYFEAGMRKSIAKVMSFGALDASADMTYAPDAAAVDAFVALKVAEFNAAPMANVLDGNGFPSTKGKMELLGEQYFVSQFGAGADAFNFMRRTGLPAGMSRNFGALPGDFPSTVLYPTGEVSANPNIDQRTDLNTQVFWDPGLVNPANNQ